MKTIDRSLLVAAALATLVPACAAPTDATDGAQATTDPLATDNGAPLWTQNGNHIPVCYDTVGIDGTVWPAGMWDYEKAIAHDAVMKTWEQAANVSFDGWGDCPTSGSQKFVRIQIGINTDTDQGADGQSEGIGMQTLHAASDGPSVKWWWEREHAEVTSRLQYVAVHEMGHVLGFVHEQQRKDAPQSGPSYCDNVNPLDQSSVGITVFDPKSVMNYCGPNDGKLSPLDVEGVRSVYGRKPEGSLVGIGGLCANVQGANLDTGTTIWSWPCLGHAEDTWLMTPPDGNGEVRFFGGNRCELGTVNLLGGNGIPITTDACGGGGTTADDYWQLTRTRIVGYGNNCLDTNGPNSYVVMRACNGSASQEWAFKGSTIVNVAANQCLDVHYASDFDGAKVDVAGCNGTRAQQWSMMTGGRLHPSSSATRVLDVSGFGVNDGTPVGIWTQKTSNIANQQWFLRTTLLSSHDDVLDVPGQSTWPGVAYWVWAPWGGPNQDFDYYF